MANILHIFPVKIRSAVPFSQIQACYLKVSTSEIIKHSGRFLDSSQMCAETIKLRKTFFWKESTRDF